MLAGHMQRGIGEQVIAVPPQAPESDPFGMSQQPGGFVVTLGG